MPKNKVVFPPMDVPEPVVDGLLLYQAETSLAKLVERSLLKSGLSLPQTLLLGALYWDGRGLVPRHMRNTLVVEFTELHRPHRPPGGARPGEAPQSPQGSPQDAGADNAQGPPEV